MKPAPRKLQRTPLVRSTPTPRSLSELEALGGDAFFGLVGEIVREIEPHTEADPAAILVQLLAAVGNAVGRGPGFEVGAERHHANLFVGIVGATSSSRKGGSWAEARRLVVQADTTWADRIVTGASTGEGLIWHVRDPGEKSKGAKNRPKTSKAGNAKGKSDKDQGVNDKRLLIVESELASVLERMGRDGNTLSAVLRQAWDGGRLSTLVKNDPNTATGAHISLIGHITPEELARKLTATEQANGFANRFLWIYARRSKELPLGGKLHEVNWAPYVVRLERAIRNAPQQPLPFAKNARGEWRRAYRHLTNPPPGLLGAVTARGPAQVRRLAVIYAVTDESSVITVDHLRAALAIWRYSADSAAVLFGKSLGDPTADVILARVKAAPGGLLQKEIHDAFGRHRSASEIERALTVLTDRKLIHSKTESTGGRPATRWFAGPQPRKSDSARTKRRKRANG